MLFKTIKVTFFMIFFDIPTTKLLACKLKICKQLYNCVKEKSIPISQKYSYVNIYVMDLGVLNYVMYLLCKYNLRGKYFLFSAFILKAIVLMYFLFNLHL